MNLHEFQAKGFLQRASIPVPPFHIVTSVDQAIDFIDIHHVQTAVVKAQIHAGGRGKAGGVKLGRNRDEIIAHVKNILGMRIVNAQTGSEGIVVRQVMLCAPIEIAHEYYVAFVIDRKLGRPVLMLSREGGVNIEEVAACSPEKVLVVPTSLDGLLLPAQVDAINRFMQWQGGDKILAALSKTALSLDALLFEINPLVEDKEGRLFALDAKCCIDDNALFRQEEVAAMFDPSQLSQSEVIAHAEDLSYIKLDGEIGCMVNGAGLAMATMDIIQFFGGSPANFLDVGGGASAEKVKKGLQIILNDPKVKAILINIFGGIMKCDVIAEGIILAAKEIDIQVPLIVRLEGTRVHEGKQLLLQSNLHVITADDLREAAQKAVQSVRGA